MSSSILRTNYAQLMFYVREKYWRHAEELCTQTIQTTDDWLFRVWRGMCYDQQGLVNEALREYKAAEVRRETAVPAIMGIWIIYKRNKDTEGAAMTEMKLSAEKFAKDVDGWVQAATLCWASGDVSEAHDILLKYPESLLQEHRDEYTNLATMRGWVDLTSGRGAFLEKCGTAFQRALDIESSSSSSSGISSAASALDINAAMGRVAYLERKYQFPAAQDLLNRLIVAHPNFVSALVVKARLLMRAEDWEQSTETTKRILVKDKNNIEAIALEALYALVKDTRYAAASTYLNRLLAAVQEREPRNAPLMYQFAQAFSRLSGDNLMLLGITIKFAELACQMDGRNGDYQCEVGFQQVYRGDYKAALATFEKAATHTDSVTPLLGTIVCYVQTGKLPEAAKQVAFCNELQSGLQRGPLLSLLNAQLLWRVQKDETKSLLMLDQAAEALRQEVHAQVGNGMELYVKLNQPLLLEIAREYMQHCRNEPPDPSFRHPDVVAEKCRKHLELLTRHVPGCMEAQLMLSKIHFVSGDLNQAQVIIRACLRQEQPLPEAYLLSAQVCLYMGNVSLANQALEQALTLDFELKDHPFYNLLRGIVLGMMGKAAPSLESLQRALTITSGMEKGTAATTTGSTTTAAAAATITTTTTATSGRPLKPLSVPDHVTLYLQLAQAHLRVHDADEARKVLSEAVNHFRNTTQYGRVSIAQAMLVARTEVDKGIAILREVPTTSEFFITARTQMAKLYLTQKHNPVKYAECFEEMVKESPSAEGYVELGEAYSTIQEPEKAIATYEKARALAPQNSELAVRIGRALVSTHDYEKAVRYYEDALATNEHLFNVRADLAMLHWHLGDTALAIQTIEEAPVYRNSNDAATLADEDTIRAVERVNCALLLYKIHAGSGSSGGGGGKSSAPSATALQCLQKARDWQQQLLSNKLRSETRETVLQQKSIMASICTELARNYTFGSGSGRSADGVNAEAMTSARECLTEALKFDEGNELAMLELARLYFHMHDADACEQQCNSILKMNPSCEEAVVLLADLMVSRCRFDDAGAHFRQLLDASPGNYEALVQYVRLLCRAGKLEDAEKIIEHVEASAAPAGQRPDPGLSYARGLWSRYSNMSADALRAFNLARLPSDNPWATRALVRMIEIYLVPTTQDVWVDTWSVDEKTDNVRSAEQLILQLPIGETRMLLEAHCLLASKQPSKLEKAMQMFLMVIGTTQGGKGEGAGAATSSGSNHDIIAKQQQQQQQRNIALEEMDEDDLLLKDMHEAAGDASSAAAATAAAGTAATLASALDCKVVHAAAFLGLAISLYLQKQEMAARNVLARVLPVTTRGAAVAAASATGGESSEASAASGSPTIPIAVRFGEDAETVERAMLLSAQMDIQAGHFDAAQQTLRAVLESDKSCGTAWDSLGMLYERQQLHKEASECYQSAWSLVKEGDPSVGYKLAFNYLKGNDLVKAIDVSKKVLSQHAAYPRIETDVMDVAYSLLRP